VTSQSFTLAGAGDDAESLDLLIERARSGEESAYEEILRRFEGKAIGVARNLGASRQDAEDIAQESFLRLFRHIASYRGGRRFTAYFYRIVINVARDHMRAARGPGASSSLEPELDALPSGAMPAIEDLELKQRLRLALLTLAPREREVIVLKEIHGLSTWEVSKILRLDPITVRRHAMRARERLKKKL